ncbi:MAG: tRNA preQ1(34) S-adenosylmethionine ribosyltransferase-isomerase QueA [Gammaproteobacteria bacterium]|nr:tRNA preQ1(34) S-adenosylmethionine ribosyltransferase-isomerase QueA [Gammaproteobacteria bacterium]MDH4252993.1 tRNA preQ1(34) S-adenosylmethionine ribosyltransferase-isomerase QueA [Gammaproteobacteria bacterium]MDH5308585.1 tRNA preQ1(34) S-adenosylmethionine ribosyltransferase-isomerase QueA [Gammaproteobacteria bacterium]
MFLSDFDYELPDRLIARYPAAERRASRLLVVDGRAGTLEDRAFPDLCAYLRAGDLLVLNDTRVIKARLHGAKDTGGKVEVLVERLIGEAKALAQLKASKVPKPGSQIRLPGGCSARVLGRSDDLYELEFSRPVHALLEAHGEVPLPPYLERDAEASDTERYQTVYAREHGAVAAPTAGLHIDEQLLADLDAAGVGRAFVTLHVGAGTFQSLRHEDIDANRLHHERVEVSSAAAQAINATRASGGRIIAVGTTSVRALEAAGSGGEMRAMSGETDLFIRPGYRFGYVDALLTNFHLPRSSLLMLVAAFAGYERIMEAYRHAVRQNYRFFSYGDAMLILPAGGLQ